MVPSIWSYGELTVDIQFIEGTANSPIVKGGYDALTQENESIFLRTMCLYTIMLL